VDERGDDAIAVVEAGKGTAVGDARTGSGLDALFAILARLRVSSESLVV
jgi:hypothetical protein